MDQIILIIIYLVQLVHIKKIENILPNSFILFIFNKMNNPSNHNENNSSLITKAKQYLLDMKQNIDNIISHLENPQELTITINTNDSEIDLIDTIKKTPIAERNNILEQIKLKYIQDFNLQNDKFITLSQNNLDKKIKKFKNKYKHINNIMSNDKKIKKFYKKHVDTK